VRALAVLLGSTLAACDTRPADAELDRMRAEVDAANRAALDQLAKREGSGAGPGDSLTIQGAVYAAATLRWRDLEELATTAIDIHDVQQPGRTTPTHFRGVLLRDLLARYDASPDANDITVVSVDGFRATVAAADARAYRMLLAIEADGKPITRAHGGPIYLVHPYDEAPELRDRYPDRFWSFYVTHVVVGTEPARLDVAGHVLDAAALAAIPPHSWDGHVGFHVEWPADSVHLRGVELGAAIAAAGVTVPPNATIIIHGKAAIADDPKAPIAFTAADLAACRPLLATHYGTDEQPIPARLGGPIALALPACNDRYSDRVWAAFVERIEVRP
jgi:hypothetical protein